MCTTDGALMQKAPSIRKSETRDKNCNKSPNFYRTNNSTCQQCKFYYGGPGPIRTGNADKSQSDGSSRLPENRQHSALLIWNSSSIRSLMLGVREEPCAWLSSAVPALIRPGWRYGQLFKIYLMKHKNDENIEFKPPSFWTNKYLKIKVLPNLFLFDSI